MSGLILASGHVAPAWFTGTKWSVPVTVLVVGKRGR